jgi:hypothetical protein
MWYNEEQQTRGNEVIFPDGLKISAADADKSPVRGWEWHEQPPQWWNDINPESDGLES